MPVEKTHGAWGSAWSFTDKGFANINEDLVYQDAATGFYLVCDGVGGTGAGLEASRILQETLQEELARGKALIEEAQADPTKAKRDNVEKFLDQAFQSAAKRIFAHAKSDPKKNGSCTTADALLLLGNYALIAHAGPGRVFLLRKAELHQLTEDHTQLAQLRRQGKLDTIPPAQQAGYARRLTRAIGHQEQTKLDFLELELQKGDFLFLCSDGFWMTMGESTVEKILPSLIADPTTLVEKEAADCNARSPKDNFSLLLVDLSGARANMGESSADLKIQLTGKVPLFRFLSYQEIIKVINVAELFKVGAGATICKEGDAGGEMMVLLEGAADVLKQGKKIAELKKGDAFGEMTMIDTGPRTASIVASVPSNLLAFPRDALFALLREEPQLAVKFLWGLSKELNKRLKTTSDQLVGKKADHSAQDNKGPLPFLYSKDIH